jgi:hypothetical protein
MLKALPDATAAAAVAAAASAPCAFCSRAGRRIETAFGAR